MIDGLVAGRQRRTLAHPSICCEGIGLHTGEAVSVRIVPASAGVGRVFRSASWAEDIPATLDFAVETERCTILRRGEDSLQTVEHLLAALLAMGIDDCIIEVAGPEIPAMDGSAQPFLCLLSDAGTTDSSPSTSSPRRELQKPIFWGDPSGAILAATPARQFHLAVLLDYPQTWIGQQSMTINAARDSSDAFASARTYGFAHELDALRGEGLALGASEENALGLGYDGYLNTPRFSNELARHKALDFLGDLALIGFIPTASFLAYKPSHASNIRFGRIIAEAAAPAP